MVNSCFVYRLTEGYEDRELAYVKPHDDECYIIDWRPDWSVDCVEQRLLEADTLEFMFDDDEDD